MFTIMADSVGRHDFLLTPCSQEMFEKLHHCQGHHPSCFKNLCVAFAAHGIRPEQISTIFSIFMNVELDQYGTVRVLQPRSQPVDFIEMCAEMDVVCGLTTCSAEQLNIGAFKPIDFCIVRAAKASA